MRILIVVVVLGLALALFGMVQLRPAQQPAPPVTPEPTVLDEANADLLHAQATQARARAETDAQAAAMTRREQEAALAARIEWQRKTSDVYLLALTLLIGICLAALLALTLALLLRLYLGPEWRSMVLKARRKANLPPDISPPGPPDDGPRSGAGAPQQREAPSPRGRHRRYVE